MVGIKDTIIIVMVVTGFGVGVFGFAIDLLGNYDIDEGNFTATESSLAATLSETTNLTESVQTKIQQSEGISVLSGIAVLSKGALAGLRLPFDMIRFLGNLFTDIANVIGVPGWLFSVGMGVIIISLAAAVYSALLRKEI